MATEYATQFATIQGRRLEYLRLAGSAPQLVFLHEGLGSISLWRDFPARLAASTGCETIVYSRYGYGQSAVLAEPRETGYMHDEALLVLPQLLEALGVADPVLIGHSDGASIALIYAGSGRRALGIIAEAPHVFVEDISISSIVAAKTAFETTDLPQKLARHHRDAGRTFTGWNDIWQHADFRAWNIEACLPGVTCPVLAIQGLDDEYGTLAQLDAIAARVSGPLRQLRLPDCKHSPHRDQPERTLEAMTRFVRSLAESRS
ncbi:MAG: alpha/beta hydrolase [Betaproteobacteria bacterium]|nr:alpha/beta hydrolase [Betaproteobacteria bacterium]